MSKDLSPCCCGSTDLKELKPYGIESVQCRDCHVSLRKQDWNRIMLTRAPESVRLTQNMATSILQPAIILAWPEMMTGLPLGQGQRTELMTDQHHQEAITFSLKLPMSELAFIEAAKPEKLSSTKAMKTPPQ